MTESSGSDVRSEAQRERLIAQGYKLERDEARAEVERLRQDLEHRARALATLDREIERLRGELEDARDGWGEDEDYVRVKRQRDAAETEVERLREQRSVTVTKLAAILRLTYDEDMPERLADQIRPLCAHPADHPDVRRSVAQTPSSDISGVMENAIRTTLRIKGIRLHDSVIRALAREARIAYEAEVKRREADRAPRWAR